ncbi:hypothetical protein D3C83_20050 [compost metagenome]
MTLASPSTSMAGLLPIAVTPPIAAGSIWPMQPKKWLASTTGRRRRNRMFEKPAVAPLPVKRLTVSGTISSSVLTTSRGSTYPGSIRNSARSSKWPLSRFLVSAVR